MKKFILLFFVISALIVSSLTIASCDYVVDSGSDSVRNSSAESDFDSESPKESLKDSTSQSESSSEIEAEPTDAEWFKFTLLADESGYSVAKCDNYDAETYPTEIVVPKTYNDKPVTKIENEAFNVCYRLTSVIIPKGITEIGNKAFYYCSRRRDDYRRRSV